MISSVCLNVLMSVCSQFLKITNEAGYPRKDGCRNSKFGVLIHIIVNILRPTPPTQTAQASYLGDYQQ